MPTTLPLLLALLAPAAHAFGSATRIAGTSEFEGCLDDPGCSEAFYDFLGGSMAENGFTFQHGMLVADPVLVDRPGFSAGAMLDTFPFGDPPTNLSGKPENTRYSPVLPRLVGGWQGEVAGWRAGAEAFFLPPVPVQGASALVGGLAASAARGVAEGWVVGVAAELTGVRAEAPIVASEEQFASRDEFSNPDNLDPDTYEAVCEAAEDGCIDTFSLLNPSLLLGGAWRGPAGLSPYARLGLTLLSERLWVMYDDTTWGLVALQPVAHAGLSWVRGDHLALVAGGALAWQGTGIGGPGVFWKLQAAASWGF